MELLSETHAPVPLQRPLPLRPLSGKHYGGLFFIALFAFIVGISYWLRTNTPGSQTSDARQYSRLATSLIEQGKFDYSKEAVIVPPLYPTYLALIYLLAGKGNFTAASIANITLFALIAGLITWTSMRLYGFAAGFLAGLLVVFNHDLLFVAQFALSEMLFTLLLVFATLALYAYVQQWKIRWLALAGLCMGLAALARGVFLIYLLPAILWILIVCSGTILFRFLNAAIFCGIILMIITPWSYWISAQRNIMVPVIDYGSLTVYLGNNSAYYHALKEFLFTSADPWKTFQLPNVPNDQMLLEVWRFISGSPWDWMQLYLLKLIYHLQFFNLKEIPSITIAIWGGVYWVIIWFLLIVYLAKTHKAWRSIFLWIVAGNLFLQPLIHVAKYSRYRVPIDPLLILLASGGASILIPPLFQYLSRVSQTIRASYARLSSM